MTTEEVACHKVWVAKLSLITMFILAVIMPYFYDAYIVWGACWVISGFIAMILVYKDWRMTYIPITMVAYGFIGIAGLLMACIPEVHTTNYDEFTKKEQKS